MKERFEVLDVFRGIFSSMVVLFHLSAFSATPLINNRFIYNTDLFVDFFFILSGFVIAYNYTHISTGTQLKNFYLKRFLRLYPLHFIVLIAFIGIELLKGFASHYVHVNKLNNESNSIHTVITNLLLVNSVKMPGVHDVSWNIASWSISAEMIAYLVFGLTAVAINHYAKGFKVLVYGLVAVTAAVLLYAFTGGFKLIYTFDYGFLRGITGFFTGVLCLWAYSGLKDTAANWSKITFHILEPLVMTITLVMVCFGDELKNYGLIYELLFFINVLIFSFEKGWLSAMLKKPKVLRQTGKYSYSIYMTHTLVLSLFNIVFIRVLKLPPSAYAYLFIPNFLIIYWVSAWTFKNIEMRFNKLPQQDKKQEALVNGEVVR
jgi:peptidoglycan/LPS O-acetylase OafA/YrhL